MNAVISGRAGVALLLECGKLRSMHIEDLDRLIARRPEDFHLLFGDAADLEFHEGVKEEEVRQQLCSSAEREEALDLALILHDPELSEATRREAALELDELLRQPGLADHLECVLCAKPLPSTADPDRARKYCPQTANMTQAFLERLHGQQAAIRQARLAWDSVVDNEDRAMGEWWCVREGVFRGLVFALTGEQSMNDFLIRSLDKPQSSEWPNAKQVLWALVEKSRSQAPVPPRSLRFLARAVRLLDWLPGAIYDAIDRQYRPLAEKIEQAIWKDFQIRVDSQRAKRTPHPV